MLDQVDDPVGVAKLVVIPGHKLHKGGRELDPSLIREVNYNPVLRSRSILTRLQLVQMPAPAPTSPDAGSGSS